MQGQEPTTSTGRRAPAVIDAPDAPSKAKNVAIVIVTWNRWQMVSDVLEALSKQGYPTSAIDVTVVDNGSTDGTVENLTERWSPDRIVENPTPEAHQPDFQPPTTGGPNKGGFRTLTIVHNHFNHGGCGGFNTGFAYTEQVLDGPDSSAKPDYVWLVDDDVDLPSDALQQLTRVAESDEVIGMVGSRTVNIADRDETIETTIYFNEETGLMADEPSDKHRLRDAHKAWAKDVGGPKGRGDYSGVREVDVVSACSLLARWSAVKQVGFWDYRYFIYCDDADWCLRFGRAGYKVVCNLDAVVFHTPWHLKLTPARIYYAQRNMVWVLEKVLPSHLRRKGVFRRLAGIMKDSEMAALRRRLFHAEIIRRTAHDVVTGRRGKLDYAGPPMEPVEDALERIGSLKPSSRIIVLCNQRESVEWAEELRERVGGSPKWLYLVRNDIDENPSVEGVETIVYGQSRKSRIKRVLQLLTKPARAVVIFDQTSDMPILTGPYNLHIDRKDPRVGQVERDGFWARFTFFARWTLTGFRVVWYCLTLKPYKGGTKYG